MYEIIPFRIPLKRSLNRINIDITIDLPIPYPLQNFYKTWAFAIHQDSYTINLCCNPDHKKDSQHKKDNRTSNLNKRREQNAYTQKH